MPKGTKKEIADAVSRLAYDLAMSGKYQGYPEVEVAVRAQYPDARKYIGGVQSKEEINRACRDAQGKYTQPAVRKGW